MIRLVLAEDQTMVRDAFAALLSLEDDLEVVAAVPDGAAALEAVAAHDPDIVVTDIEMPLMSGLDLAAALAADHSRTRVMIVTTFARQGYLRRALDSGVTGYVLKDAPIAELAQALRRLHAGETVIAPELAVAAWGATEVITDRERDVLRLVGDGNTNGDIADLLGLAEGTVRNYLSSAILKVGARNRTEAHAMARDRGLL
jgi:two-component system response regulator DesR